MDILETHWMNATNDLIGLVVAKDPTTEKVNAYIGVGDGYSEEQDQEKILSWGMKIEDPSRAEIYINALKQVNET